MVGVEIGLEPVGAFLENAAVSAGARDVMAGLLHAPLGSANDVMAVLGASSSAVYGWLRELRAAGLADSVLLGWSRKGAQRWWVTEHGLEVAGAWGTTWHHESPRCRLLERLPMVETFYQVAGRLGEEFGGVSGFQWVGGVSFDAVVRCREGWGVLMWSGMMENERRVLRRLERLGGELDTLGGQERQAWPSVVCFVVADLWQKEVVLRAARKLRLEEMVSLWCVADDSWVGAVRPGSGVGRVHKRVDIRGMGAWGWERRVDEGFGWMARGVVSGRVLDVVGEWPGASLRMVSLGLGLRDVKVARRACRELVEAGLIERHWEGGMYRYVLAAKGFHLVARRDRVVNVMSQYRKHTPVWMDRGNMKTHEVGVMDLVSEFAEVGLAVAGGWRCWEHLGGSGGIAPDAMVYLRESPYGEGWHYIEYERSARGEARIFRKLRGYGSPLRQDGWPVVAVVWNEEVEGVFHDVGRERNVGMVTTTLARLAEHGAVGNDGCWRNYGDAVQLG